MDLRFMVPYTTEADKRLTRLQARCRAGRDQQEAEQCILPGRAILYQQEAWVLTHKPFPQPRDKQYQVPGVTRIRI